MNPNDAQAPDQTFLRIHNEFRRSLADELRAALKRRHLTQSAMARRLGTSRSVVARILRAQGNSTNLRSLARIMCALDATLSLQLNSEPAARESQPRRRAASLHRD
jgi:transcriptional regulator with XRE-family HTH domain